MPITAAGGTGAPRQSDGGAPRPGQPPRQDQTWQPRRSWPGTGRGNWQAGDALPGGGEGGPVAGTRGQEHTPTRVRSDSVGAAGPGRRAGGGRLRGGSPDPGARPTHRGRPGLRPGAFRARAAARLGKSRPPSGRRGPCPAERGRGFPESARRPRARHWTECAQIRAALPLRQQGKPRRARLGGAAPAHCGAAPGILPPGVRLDSVLALDPPASSPPGVWDREQGRAPRLGWGPRDAGAELAR